MTYWGHHLVLDVANCDPNAIDDYTTIFDFTKTLVDDIDMKAYGEPLIERFAEHDLDKAGYSLIQLIETSNIAAHFVPHYKEMYLDVFSCKSFDPKIVVELVKKFFGKHAVVSQTFLMRGAPR